MFKNECAHAPEHVVSIFCSIGDGVQGSFGGLEPEFQDGFKGNLVPTEPEVEKAVVIVSLATFHEVIEFYDLLYNILIPDVNRFV